MLQAENYELYPENSQKVDRFVYILGQIERFVQMQDVQGNAIDIDRYTSRLLELGTSASLG